VQQMLQQVASTPSTSRLNLQGVANIGRIMKFDHSQEVSDCTSRRSLELEAVNLKGKTLSILSTDDRYTKLLFGITPQF